MIEYVCLPGGAKPSESPRYMRTPFDRSSILYGTLSPSRRASFRSKPVRTVPPVSDL